MYSVSDLRLMMVTPQKMWEQAIREQAREKAMDLDLAKKIMYKKESNYDISVEEGTYNVHRKPRAKPDALGKNEALVERAGYIPAKKQISNLLTAGEKLEEYRKKMYSNEPTPDSVTPDPTLRKDFGELEAHDLAKSVGGKLKKQAAEQKKAAEEQAKFEAELAELEREKLKKSAEIANSEKSEKNES